MRGLRTIASLVLLSLVAACAPDAQPTLHDIYLYGLDAENVRYSFFYGAPTEFELDGETLSLEEGDADAPFAVERALLVGGAPHATAAVEPIEPPVTAARIPLTTSLQVRTSAAVGEVVYFDGDTWLSLLPEAAAGVDRRVAPKPRIGRLRGLGELTQREATALADFLELRESALVVAELPEDALPERAVDGLAEYAATGLYVQEGVPLDPTAYRAPPEQLTWEVLARGSQAVGFDDPAFLRVDDEDELLQLWNRAWGSRLEVPPVPDVEFGRETILAVFQGQQPTGGYGIEVSDVVVEGSDMFIDMRFVEPEPGAVVTQQLTSPWVMLRVLRGGIDVAWFRNPATGELLGVARDVD